MTDISNVKKKFEQLLTLRQDICAVFDILKGKVEILKKIYLELVKNHAHKTYVFGIDSFHFQNALIETEYLNLLAAFKAIDNRIYCEYYSLYSMIKKYAINDVKDEKLINSASFKQSFEPYKHLDKNRSYDIKKIKDISLAIASCITELESIHSAREAELRNDRHQSELGLNIDNLVYTEMFNNHMLKAKIDMYYRYLEVFNQHHVKYFTRLLLKSKLHMGIVNEDIMIKQFNTSAGSTDISKLQRYKPQTESPQHTFIREEENKTIKSYINYENMPVSKKNVFNGIMSAAGVSESGSSTPSDDEGESVEPVDDNIEFVIGEKTTNDISGQTIEIPEKIVINQDNVIPPEKTQDDIKDIQTLEVIPEESEVGSNIGEINSEINEEHINQRVVVEGYDSLGTLVFYGNHVTKKGKRCGIVLDEPIGRNNGTVGGHKYFECDEGKGILVAPYKVKLVDNISGSDEDAAL